jgi:Protein of unknown function (DUF2934)
MLALAYFADLKTRISEIRGLLAGAGVVLTPGQGLKQALLTAEAIADAGAFPDADPPDVLLGKKKAACVAWNLAETLRPCVSRGLNMKSQLTNLKTGTVDYGVRDHGDNYFKDYELELYVAAECIKKGLPNVGLNSVGNAPDGDLYLESLRGEVKHLDSFKQANKCLKSFNEALRGNNMYGVIAMGIEDMYEIAPPRMFDTEAQWNDWIAEKRMEVDFNAKRYYQTVNDKERVLVAVQVWTIWRPIGGKISLVREGNAMLFDNRIGVPPQQYVDAERIARVFNPDFRKWSEEEADVSMLFSPAEISVRRIGLHKRAYQVWQEEGEPEGRALDNWLQAKADYGIPVALLI